MMTDNALANFYKVHGNLRRGGDTGKRGAEHGSFSHLCKKQVIIVRNVLYARALLS